MNTNRSSFILIVGSGTCVPSLKRSACSILVQTGDADILLDAGPGTMHRLLEGGVEVYDITHLFFSHFHPDHTGELVAFLFSNKYPYEDARIRPLVMGGGPGFRDFFNGLKKIYGHWIDLGPDRFRLDEIQPGKDGKKIFGDVVIETENMRHSPESVAYKIHTPEGKSIVYSGDTDYTENLISFSKNADILVCESAVPDDWKVDGHLTPSLAGKIAEKAMVKKLVLTHFYPVCDLSDIEAECRKTYGGPLVLAEDLMTIRIEDE